MLFLDSPLSGRCDGIAGRHAWQALPWGHSNFSVAHWLQTIWVYFGDSIPEMLGGTCGTAIFDETHHVVAFFHLAGDDGGAESIAAQHLIQEGMVLDKIVED